MNIKLLDPNEFINAYPEIIEDCLDLGGTVTGTFIKFNRTGSYMAVGCYDGAILIYDFDTRSVIRELTVKTGDGHVGMITGISFSRRSERLLTCSYDRKILVWDVLEGKVEKSFLMDSPVITAQLHPNNSDIALVCPLEIPLLMDLKTGKKTPLPVTKNESSKKRQDTIVASFNRKGDKIYVGNSLGQLTIIETESLKVLDSFSVATQRNVGKYSNAILAIVFSKRGKYFLLHCGDKLRLFNAETNQQEREFKDIINNTRYTWIAFSGKTVISDKTWDSDYVIAGSTHEIFIWDRQTGDLVKILDEVKDNVICLEWHPYKPILVTSTRGGTICIWSKNYTENWSAFAPDFQEIEQNETYIEREDEFDIKDDEEELKVKKQEEEEDVEVNIEDIDRGPWESDVSDQEIIIPTYPIKDSEMEKEKEVVVVKKSVKKSAPKKEKKKKPKKRKRNEIDDDDDDDDFIDDGDDDDGDEEWTDNKKKKKRSKKKK